MSDKIKILELATARIPYYMYAHTISGGFFIYAHPEKASFFQTKETMSRQFLDIMVKLVAIKYYNESTDDPLGNIKKIDFDTPVDQKIEIGDCLLTSNFKINYKARIIVDNFTHEVLLDLSDAGEYSDKLNSDINLPDPARDEKINIKQKAFELAKEQYNSKLIQLIYEQPIFFKKIISFGTPFSIDKIKKYFDLIDWEEISCNANIDWSIECINEFSTHLNWNEFSKSNSWSYTLLQHFEANIDWTAFSQNIRVNWEIILTHYEERLDWVQISKNESFPWSQHNIRKYSSKVDWQALSKNKNADFDNNLIREFSDKVDWGALSANTGIWWTIQMLDEFRGKLSWYSLCLHANFWNKDTIRYFREEISTDYRFVQLSQNQKVQWTEELLEELKDNLAWPYLTENPGLPWSTGLIEKYRDVWTWSYLGAIIWDIDFAEKNIHDFVNINGSCSLWKNKIILQNEDFCIRHKDILFLKNKGQGMMRFIDASANEFLPISINLLFAVKDNLDWNNHLIKMLKKTGKYHSILKEIDTNLYDLILNTDHFKI